MSEFAGARKALLLLFPPSFLTLSTQPPSRLVLFVAAPLTGDESKPLPRLLSRMSTAKPRETLAKRCSNHMSFQLKTTTKRNPVPQQREDEGTSSFDDISKTPARQVGVAATSKNFARKVDSVGIANALNFSPSKTRKKRPGSNFPPNSDPQTLLAARTRLSRQNSQVTQVDILTTRLPSTSIDSDVEHITECANMWSIIGFLISSLHFVIYAAFALGGSESLPYFYSWIVKPLSYTAMAISFTLKPRREDYAYKCILHLQYGLLTVGSQVCYVLGTDQRQEKIISSIMYIFGWLILYPICLRVRSSISKLSDDDLTEFLSMIVLKEGLIVGMAQLAFLAFSSLQCSSEAR